MNRREFELLRDLPDKEISTDIVFTSSKDRPVTLTFEQVQVYNSGSVRFSSLNRLTLARDFT